MANEAVDYAELLTTLQAKRDALIQVMQGLEMAISGLEVIVVGSGSTGSGVGTARGSKTGGIKADAFYKMSVTDAAKKYLAMATEPRTIAEITKALNAGGLSCQEASVMTIISKSAKTGDFEKIGNGQWGLPEWYKERKENGVNP